MQVNCKRANASDPNSGIYILTRADGMEVELARYPSGWVLELAAVSQKAFPTKREAVEWFSNN